MRPWFYLVRKRDERHPSGEERRWSGSENTQGILRRRLSLSLSRALSLALFKQNIRSDCSELCGGTKRSGRSSAPRLLQQRRTEGGSKGQTVTGRSTPLQGRRFGGAQRWEATECNCVCCWTEVYFSGICTLHEYLL